MKKLMRTRNNRIIFGVCGGIAEYFNIDPTIVRIAWFLFALPSFGTLAIAYLICGFIIPEDDGVIYHDENSNNYKANENTPLLIGGGLIILGVYLIGRIYFPWLRLSYMNLTRFWPVLLIVLGIYILVNHNKDK